MNQFDQFCNHIIQEQYTITAREVLYRRYGKAVADSMIDKIRARGKDDYLKKKYVLPDYSQKNLDRIIKVVLHNFDTPILGNENSPYSINKATALGSPRWTDNNPRIWLNTNQPNEIDDSVKELEGIEPTSFTKRGFPTDVLGHETTHTLQQHDLAHKLNTPRLAYEFAAVLSEIKLWYYKKTRILLDADATDAQINQFINYCKERNIFNDAAYGDKIDFEKLLRTSEGKEVFRRIVKQTPVKTNTAIA
jgi:hypothetical protein